jgi:hypothetical protein
MNAPPPTGMRRQCHDCGDAFSLDAATLAWFVDRGMPPPQRCQRCLDARRRARVWLETKATPRGAR